MKRVKMLGYVAVAAAALMAVAGVGSASATELTCGASMCAAETTIEAASEGKIVFDAPFGNIECDSTFAGHTENTGSSTETVKHITVRFTMTNCGSNTVFVLSAGTKEFHTHLSTANNNARVTSTHLKIKFVHLGVECIAETNNTELGTLTGSATTGGNATLDISATLPITGGSGGAFCGTSGPLTGSYKVTSPATLNVD